MQGKNKWHRGLKGEYVMDARESALRFLSYRDRTSMEVKKHLLEKGYEKEEIESVAEELAQWSYINDGEYAGKYFQYVEKKGRSIGRMRKELQMKGVCTEDINRGLHLWEEVAGSLAGREYEAAKQQAMKISDGKLGDPKTSGKIARRLSSLGYPSQLIYQILGECQRGSVRDEDVIEDI